MAEAISGGLAHALGLPMPEIVLMDLDAELARTEGDPEIQDLIKASAGLNLGMDYLPGAINFDPVAEQPDAELASRIVWFDAFTSNVDRTARNPNLLVWHGRLQLIDHGASLYFHHGWDGDTAQAGKPFALIRDHVLLRWADRIAEVDAGWPGACRRRSSPTSSPRCPTTGCRDRTRSATRPASAPPTWTTCASGWRSARASCRR